MEKILSSRAGEAAIAVEFLQPVIAAIRDEDAMDFARTRIDGDAVRDLDRLCLCHVWVQAKP